jgi:hypothetical protein
LALEKSELKLVRRVIERLEHLSADSIYAHRASGLRGSLLRYQMRLEEGERLSREGLVKLDQLMDEGFKILELAGKEISIKR